LGLVLACAGAMAENQSLDFKEVYELIRTNLVGASQAQLDQAAAVGLIDQLEPKVALLTNQTQAGEQTNASSIAHTAVFDRFCGYVRLDQIKPGTERELMDAYKNLSSSNRLKGLVLDLRFTSSHDYAAAASVADWFFPTERSLIDYGQGQKKSTVKTNAYKGPLAILVNQKTAGAAEALVAVLRQADVGVIIGSPTAGHATIDQEFTLRTGQHLRVATASIKLGNGQPLPVAPVKPDILVVVDPAEEAHYLEDPYTKLARTGVLAGTSVGSTNLLSSTTNRTRHRINEAELVRMLRDGESFEGESNLTTRTLEMVRPTVKDPVLVRALDLIKGLAVLRQYRTL